MPSAGMGRASVMEAELPVSAVEEGVAWVQEGWGRVMFNLT